MCPAVLPEAPDPGGGRGPGLAPVSGQVPVSPQRPPWALASPASLRPERLPLCAGISPSPSLQQGPALPIRRPSTCPPPRAPLWPPPATSRLSPGLSASPAALGGTALPHVAPEPERRATATPRPQHRLLAPCCLRRLHVPVRWALSARPVACQPRAPQGTWTTVQRRVTGGIQERPARDFRPHGPGVPAHPGSPTSRGGRRPLISQRPEKFNVLFKFSAFLKRIMQHSAHLLVKLRTVICYLGLPPSTKDAFLVLR